MFIYNVMEYYYLQGVKRACENKDSAKHYGRCSMACSIISILVSVVGIVIIPCIFLIIPLITIL